MPVNPGSRHRRILTSLLLNALRRHCGLRRLRHFLGPQPSRTDSAGPVHLLWSLIPCRCYDTRSPALQPSRTTVLLERCCSFPSSALRDLKATAPSSVSPSDDRGGRPPF